MASERLSTRMEKGMKANGKMELSMVRGYTIFKTEIHTTAASFTVFNKATEL